MVFGSSTYTSVTPATPSGTPTASSFGATSVGLVSPSSATSPPQLPPQGRRLAEFATFLGDYKVAVNVWETLRKEGKGGAVSILSYDTFDPTFLTH